jgi:hypothetical protein
VTRAKANSNVRIEIPPETNFPGVYSSGSSIRVSFGPRPPLPTGQNQKARRTNVPVCRTARSARHKCVLRGVKRLFDMGSISKQFTAASAVLVGSIVVFRNMLDQANRKSHVHDHESVRTLVSADMSVRLNVSPRRMSVAKLPRQVSRIHSWRGISRKGRVWFISRKLAAPPGAISSQVIKNRSVAAME